MTTQTNTHKPNRSRRGFTLAELLVALGVLLLLILGINQIFTSVTRVVSVGSGVADTNAAARIIERQLRDDFAALARIPADQNFIAIRNRKLGDINDNGQVDTGDDERAIYLNDDDRRFDLENGIAPYAERSRAVTVRLDEIVFMGIAPGGSGYQSFQQFGRGTDGVNQNLPEADFPVIADAALISYGHGLRPFPDEDFDPTVEPTDDTDASGVIVRQMVPDGDFGQTTGQPNVFRLTNGPSDNGDGTFDRVSRLARNEFAGSFFVLRQAALLYGGLALGTRTDTGAADIIAGPVLNTRAVIPFVRDWEIAPRLNAADFYTGAIGLDETLGGPVDTELPDPRLRRMGRSDIIAMTREDVQRWLEGIQGPPIDLDFFADERLSLVRAPRPDASPFSAGPLESVQILNNNTDAEPALNDPVITDVNTGLFGEPDDALWPRQGWPTIAQDLNNNTRVEEFEVRPYNDDLNATAPAGLRTIDRRTPLYNDALPFAGDNRGRLVQVANTRGLTSAIAGTITRMLAETEPPRFNRQVRTVAGADITETGALMDLHAVLATRCSSLEIAWNNGWIWRPSDALNIGEDSDFTLNNIEYPEGSARLDLGDGRVVAIRPGQRIWFDFEMSQIEFICAGVNAYGPAFLRLYPMPDLIAEVPRGTRILSVNDVTFFDSDHAFDLTTGGNDLAEQLGVFTPDAPAAFRNNLMIRNLAANARPETGLYDWRLSMGAENPDHEYLKVFPFRRPAPTPDGAYAEAWAKPELVRFRFTLHDERFRVEGGRMYEFIMGVNPVD
ncbi:MAG: prepilin-type N-terminal cleavage/methylation domain-containing protein [Phycisphaerales bacterium]